MNNISTQPYQFTIDDNVIVWDTFQGEMMNETYNFASELSTAIEVSKRDNDGNGVWIIQKSYKGGRLQLYNNLDPIKSGGEARIYNEILRSQVFFRYGPLMTSARGYSREAAQGQPFFDYLQDETRALAYVVKDSISGAVIHEFFSEAISASQVYFRAPTTPGTLNNRGSYWPVSDTGISNQSDRANVFVSQWANVIEKFTAENTVISDETSNTSATFGAQWRTSNFNLSKWRIFVDASVIQNVQLATANFFPNNKYAVDKMTGDNPDGSIVYTTNQGFQIRAVRNLGRTIKDYIGYITDNFSDNIPDRKWSTITGPTGSLTGISKTNLTKTAMVIIPRDEIGVDTYFLDPPQTKFRYAGAYNERVVFTSYKILAKSQSAIYKQTKGTDGSPTYTKQTNSDLIGIWIDSPKATSADDTYKNLKVIMGNDGIKSYDNYHQNPEGREKYAKANQGLNTKKEEAIIKKAFKK